MVNQRRAPRKGTRGGRGGGGGSSSGIKSFLISALVLLLGLGAFLGLLRYNHIYTLDSFVHWFQGTGGAVASKTSGVDLKNISVCNFVKDPTCLYLKTNLDKIGDQNGDGQITNEDGDIYRDKMTTIEQQQSDGSTKQPASPSDDDEANKVTDNTQKGNKSKTGALTGIPIKDSDHTKYKASEWPHWTTVSDSCDTREQVLKKAGFPSDPKTCQPTGAAPSTDYVDPFTGDIENDPNRLVVRPVVPLEYAASHGGASWTPDQRKQFANDTDNLIPTASRKSLRVKAPKTGACKWATIWKTMATKYGMGMSESDQKTVADALTTCQ